MLVSGQLLTTRGAAIPSLSACGLAERAVRRAWATLGQGDWTIEGLLAQWRALVVAEGRWQPHCHGDYSPRRCPSPPRCCTPSTRTAGRWSNSPLAAKQMLGAARQFVSAPETCRRLPALALLAGVILSYPAATAPAIPTGFWDRRPRPTPGRLRRALARIPFPQDCPLPARIHEKPARTDHLRKGFSGATTAAHPRTRGRPGAPATA